MGLSRTESQGLPNSSNLSFVEALYGEYMRNPESVEPEWRRFFERLGHDGVPRDGWRIGPSFRPTSIFNPPGAATNGARAPRAADAAYRQDRVDQLVRVYRLRGHQIARIDPLRRPRPHLPELEPQYHGFTEADLDHPFSTRTIAGSDVRTLREIIELLRNTYCRSIGVQFMHIDDLNLRHWLQNQMESTQNRIKLSRAEQLRILTRLTDAVIFEEFVQTKYVGAKRFSLEGAESLIPLLDLAIERAGDQGVVEVVLGMAHRGRLNVLANVMGKSPQEIFREFNDADPIYFGAGDVKYHLGYSTDWITSTGARVHLSLCFNPSHLEFVNPVALGRMRAKQDRCKDVERRRGMVILVHGEAAFVGEGIVQETLNLSQLRGYSVGGTLHVIVNNQIGFTTPPSEGRSSQYASALAKMLQIPLFHVNGEDPEAVAQVVNLAMEFRRDYQRDVVIDMYCYRRHGHNEADEPSFTQPLLYKAIRSRESVRHGYLEHLLALGEITVDEADEIAMERRERLEAALSAARSDHSTLEPSALKGVWSGYFGGSHRTADNVKTAVNRAKLVHLLELQANVPADFRPHPKIAKLLEARAEMARGERPLDWATAEMLALATIAVDGHPVRLSGQDSERGTFSHRHAVLHDCEDGHTYTPLANLSPDQARVEIINSPLSEAGVLGFEYGYSLDRPEGLVVWEAQFGDFSNSAQVIIDQFITSAEDKWRRLSGIVMLLPHGFEGQGPEHSSARLERYLTLAAEDNIQIAYPSTPAQFFHLLRRQVKRMWRKPLIVMTPKSMLRNPAVVSPLEDLSGGCFRPILPDERVPAERVRRVLACSGKVYYELAQARDERKRDDVAIVRVEQLYPLDDDDIQGALAAFAPDVPVVWVQEEPENMGAWRHWRVRYGERLLGHPFTGVSRPESASPATGSGNTHKVEQKQVIDRAFGELGGQ